MDALLSIKPKYSQQILNGSKRVEFRKMGFHKRVERVFIYETSPTQRIVGYMTLSKVEENHPSLLWKKYGAVGGIDYSDYQQYYTDREKGVVLVIKDVVKFPVAISPKKVFRDFVAPQSYIYIDDKLNYEEAMGL